MTKRGSRKGWIVWSVLLLILIAGGVFAVRAALKPKNEIDPSKIVAVELGDLARSVVATGKIQPKTKVEVKSKASGIVKKIYVDYGQMVRQGQLLLELDREELQARVRESTANLQAAESAVQAAEAALQRNMSEAEGTDIPFLKSAVDRADQLRKEGLIAKAAAEEADKAYQVALNKQITATRAIAVSRAEVSRTKAQVAQARAALERAEEDLRNATIVSPMDGLVLSRDVEVGDAVSSILVMGSQAKLMFTLGDVSDVYVLGKVDQADIGRVFLGQRARIVVESFKEKAFDGAVTKISPLGVEKDNVTTFEVRVSIRNPGGELKANMTANAEIILEERKGVLMIPESAILYDEKRNTFAEVPQPGSDKGKAKVAIKTGISNGVKTQILSGLAQGQKLLLQ
jgi:HlyD family secretion protein